MKKYLFLDDERMPYEVTWVRIDRAVPWDIVRNFHDAIAYVQNYGFPDMISFDHDLGEGRTGYDFAKWLVDYDMATHTMPDDFTFTVHSMNPIGAVNINRYLHNYLNFKGTKYF